MDLFGLLKYYITWKRFQWFRLWDYLQTGWEELREVTKSGVFLLSNWSVSSLVVAKPGSPCLHQIQSRGMPSSFEDHDGPKCRSLDCVVLQRNGAQVCSWKYAKGKGDLSFMADWNFYPSERRRTWVGTTHHSCLGAEVNCRVGWAQSHKPQMKGSFMETALKPEAWVKHFPRAGRNSPWLTDQKS